MISVEIKELIYLQRFKSSGLIILCHFFRRMATKNNDEEVKNHRIRLGDVVEETGKRLPPIEGFENVPLVSIEESVKPLEGLVRRVTEYAGRAKRKAIDYPTNDNVTLEESSAIRLYTMEWAGKDGGSVYTVMNACLRDKERDKMQPWYLYLKLLLTALFKLPPVSCQAYRGVKSKIYQDYLEKKGIVWWAFSSCTKSIDVLKKETFFGQSGDRTLFLLRCSDARDIKAYSAFTTEDEVLVLPGTYFKINGHLDSGNGVHIITLDETQSDVYFPARKLFAKPNASAKRPYQPKPTSPSPPQSIQPKYTPPAPQVHPPSWQSKSNPRQGGRPPVKPPSAERRRELEVRITRCRSRDTVEFRRLDLTDAEMSDIADQVIIDKECTRLILSDNNIRADGLVKLAKAAKESQTLIELNLARNHLTDDDVQALAEELTIPEIVQEEPSGCPCPWSSTKVSENLHSILSSKILFLGTRGGRRSVASAQSR